MDTLIQLFTQFNAYAKTNPLLATAVSIWGLGIVTWLFRNVPTNIYHFFKRQLTTTLTFNNTTVGTNLETFANFLEWFEKNRWSRFSRSLSLNGTWYRDGHDSTVVGIGNGTHFFVYKGRPFWMHRHQLTEGSMHQVTYEITITALGRNRQVILDLIDEFKYRPKPHSLAIFGLNEREWVRMSDINRRPLKTVIIDAVMKAEIVLQINKFLASQHWYEERGLPYKKTFIFHGIHGTGKTSLIKALASHYEYNIARINLSTMTDNLLEHALATAPKKAFILIEDFDSAGASKTRFRRKTDVAPAAPSKPGAPTSEAPKLADEATLALRNQLDLSMGMLSLSGMLNALDGVVSLDGRLVFMTTNVLAQIDPALLRKGRVDHIFELKALTHVEVCAYIDVMFPGHNRYFVDTVFEDILGCDLQSIYLDHRDDVEDFIAAIPKKSKVMGMTWPPLTTAGSAPLMIAAGSRDFNNGC